MTSQFGRSERIQAYRALCSEPGVSIPAFSQAWWLDLVVPDEWDVVLTHRGQSIVGSLPFYLRERRGMQFSEMPPLTPSLGPWVRPSSAKHVKWMSYQQRVLTDLESQLPPVARYRQRWHVGQQNWLPFYWRGYAQTTRYTYRIEPENTKEQVWDGMDVSVRGSIRKAEQCGLLVASGDQTDGLTELAAAVYERQGIPVPYDLKLLERLVAGLLSRAKGRVYRAVGTDSQVEAAALIVEDDSCAYYLVSGSDAVRRGNGGLDLCLWSAIQDALAAGLTFDFEGSMLPGVEASFRHFGATLTPYFEVSQTYNRRLVALDGWRQMRKTNG